MAVHSGGILARVRRSIALIGLLIACALLPASAHEIPADIKINVFVRPAGNMLTLLIRIPLSAMQEVDFPRRGPGYLEVSRADEALRNATRLWLVDNLAVFENGVRLPSPADRAGTHLAAVRPFVCLLRAGARAPAWPASRRRPRPLLEPAASRRDARVSDSVRRVRIRRSSPLRPAGAARLDGAPLPASRRARRGHSSCTATPGSCGSIRAGIRRRCVSSNPASGTSSPARITCCSWRAWWCRSGDSGRSSSSSPRSPSPIRSR